MIYKMYESINREDSFWQCLAELYQQKHMEEPGNKQYFYNFRAQQLIVAGDFDSARHFLHLALQQDTILRDSARFMADLASLGTIDLHLQRYRSAIGWFSKASQYIGEHTPPNQVVSLYSNMGAAYQSLEMLANAMRYLQDAYEWSKRDTQFDAATRRFLVQHNIGVIYATRGQQDRAIQLYNKLADSLASLDMPYLERLLFSSLGKSYLESGQLKEAEAALKKGLGEDFNFLYNQEELYQYLLQLYWEQKRPAAMKPIIDTLDRHYSILGQTPSPNYYLLKGKYAELSGNTAQKAEYYYRKGLQSIAHDTLPEKQALLYGALAERYAERGEHRKALEYMQQQIDAIQRSEDRQQAVLIEDYAALYELQEERKRLQQARMDRKMAMLEARKANRQKWVYIGLAFFGIGFAVMLGFNFWQYRQRSQAEQEVIRERHQRLQQEKLGTEQQLEYQKKTVLDKSLWAASLHTKVQEAVTRYHKRPEYLKRKVHEIFAEENLLEQFEREFELFYPEFARVMLKQAPQLTPKQLRYAALVGLGLRNKEIAGIQSVSVKAVEMARYRLREQLSLNREEQLDVYLRNILLSTASRPAEKPGML